MIHSHPVSVPLLLESCCTVGLVACDTAYIIIIVACRTVVRECFYMSQPLLGNDNDSLWSVFSIDTNGTGVSRCVVCVVTRLLVLVSQDSLCGF